MDEPKEGRNTGNAGKGRPKGSLNKTTTAAKDAISQAAEGLGGAERLIAWAQQDERNESAFWTTIYPKLLPLTVGGDKENPLGLTLGLSAASIELLREIAPPGADSGIPPFVPG